MSLPVKRVNGLEITEDMAFQKRFWVVQRIGWVLMLALVLAALAGLLGRGYFSAQTSGAGPLSIEYNRFAHLQANTTLTLQLAADVGTSEEVNVWLDRRYLTSLSIQQITPQPDSARVDSERVVFTFVRSEPGDPIEITFDLMPKDFGPLDGRIGILDGESVAFNQFIYP